MQYEPRKRQLSKPTSRECSRTDVGEPASSHSTSRTCQSYFAAMRSAPNHPLRGPLYFSRGLRCLVRYRVLRSLPARGALPICGSAVRALRPRSFERSVRPGGRTSVPLWVRCWPARMGHSGRRSVILASRKLKCDLDVPEMTPRTRPRVWRNCVSAISSSKHRLFLSR